jgi:hypothetical protein
MPGLELAVSPLRNKFGSGSLEDPVSPAESAAELGF